MITDINQLPADSESAFVCADCMDVMHRFPDKYFDLAIVDPPYGINVTGTPGGGKASIGGAKPFGKNRGGLAVSPKTYKAFDDSHTPDAAYFSELERVAKHRIIFGGNYFLEHLGATECIIVWDKKRRGLNFADCEIAWTDFKMPCRIFEFKWNGMLQGDMKNKEHRIHPTQKPVALYRWLIERFTKPTDIILDTHVGSASSLIAAQALNRRFVGCELDSYYYHEALKRFQQESAQLTMFNLFREI